MLDSTLNKEQQNKPFSDKIPFFKQSVIRPNEDIAAQSSWGVEEIEKRQAILAKYALEIWD